MTQARNMVAPNQVQQLVEESYLRWDSLGKFLALAASFEHSEVVNNNDEAKTYAIMRLSATLNAAIDAL